jgi:hypothetical protein
MKIKKTVWTEGQYSQFFGNITLPDRKLTVGSIGYTGNKGTPWVSRFSALGFVYVGQHATQADAIEAMEDMLELFVLSLIEDEPAPAPTDQLTLPL